MFGILFIVMLPFVIYLTYYKQSVEVGNDVSKVNAEINEVCLPEKPLIRSMAGTNIDKKYNLIEKYLKVTYPNMYYFTLKNCKVYSAYLTVEILLSDSDKPEVVSFAASEMLSDNTILLDNWIENLKGKLEEFKKEALKEKKVFFVIPWDDALKNEDFKKKVITWFENNTLYRISSDSRGLVFNFQDEMF